MYMNEESTPYIEQSAVIPYRIRQCEIEILLITSVKRKRWIIPKGIIEPDMTPQDSAAKEALEEAGIGGEVLPLSMGNYTYSKWGGICRVQVFLLRVDIVYLDWLESSLRKRQWFSLEEAIKQIEETEIKTMLMKLPDYI
jgi:8-oxo-dGTP pyrophosphatase MutT (NUDIX family)